MDYQVYLLRYSFLLQESAEMEVSDAEEHQHLRGGLGAVHLYGAGQHAFLLAVLEESAVGWRVVLIIYEEDAVDLPLLEFQQIRVSVLASCYHEAILELAIVADVE